MNYVKINLPLNPIHEHFQLQFNGEDFWHVYLKPNNVITDSLLEKFYNLQAVPDLVVIFASKNSARSSGAIHKDLKWKENRWQTVPCAINWELHPTTTTIKWYDTTNCKEYWPSKSFSETSYPFKWLNGVTYNFSALADPKTSATLPDGIILDEEATIDEKYPILFRTDVAHAVTYKTKTTETRFVCSVRFKNINYWEHALEVFSSIILK